MENFMELLVPIIAIICIFGLPVILGAYVIVKAISSRGKERMELAKHGIIAPETTKPAPNKYRALRNGIISIGIAAGLILGVVFTVNNTYEDYIKFVLITASTILFMGIAYVVFYLIVKDKKELDNDAE